MTKKSEPRRESVSIEEGGITFTGTYTVESGVLSLWTMGHDGVYIGPLTILLKGMPQKAAAEMLLRDHARGKGAQSK